MLYLGNVTANFHISTVAACAENDTHSGLGVDVVGSNERACGVVNQSFADGWHVLPPMGSMLELEVGIS